jgi:pantetheine-phosphate adenylyltransferase
MSARIAVYAGSFDPVTHGHLDVIRRSCALFDRIVVAVGENPNKGCLLDLNTRLRVLEEVTADLPEVEVTPFQGLLVDFCRGIGAMAILRGLRAVSDFEFEFQIGMANRDMAPEIESLYLLTDPTYIFISSSLVKEIASNGGDVERYIPGAAYEALMDKLRS